MTVLFFSSQVLTHTPPWSQNMKGKLEDYSRFVQFCHSAVSLTCCHSDIPTYFAYVVQYCRLVNKNQHNVNLNFYIIDC